MSEDVQQASAAPANIRRERRRGSAAASLGTIAEYFDLTVYAYLAVVISPVFFPGNDPTASLLATLAVFATAYFMRPIGGIVFGRIGDRFGRKRAMVASIIMMGLATIAMAALPSYAAIGVLAPVLLVVARLFQGLSAGGEIGGAMTYVFELFGPGRRGMGAAFVVLGGIVGNAAAAIAVAVMSALTTAEQMQTWGWRVALLLGLPLLLLCLWMRTRISDTPEFTEAARRGETAMSPLREVLRTHPKALLKLLGLAIAQNAGGYIVLTYVGIHLITVGGYDRTTVSWLSAGVILFTGLILTPLSGLLVDRFGVMRILATGLIMTALIAYPALTLMTGSGLAVAAVAYVVLVLGIPLVQTANAALFPSLFETRVRMTGLSFAFNIASVIAGGTAAYIATWLIRATGDARSPAYFVIAATLIGIATLTTVRTAGRD